MKYTRAYLALSLALVLCCTLLFLPQAQAFSDVAEDSWYYQTVTEMAQKGYLHGTPQGSFLPLKEVSKAEFVKILSNVHPLPQEEGLCAHWAAGTVQAALHAGWFDWDELPPTGEQFDEPIRREVAVRMLMAALAPELTGDYAISARIKDFSSLNGRYYSAVFAAYSAGIVQGDNYGNFHAQATLTRAEAATMVSNALAALGDTAPSPTPSGEPPTTSAVLANGVSKHGSLQVIGTQLSDADGNPVILRGMSTHGMHWYGAYASAGAIKTTADYGANVFRVAMYTGEGGYISNPTVKNAVFAAADAAIAQDMYVILDWHILSDGDPNQYLAQAKAFFTEAATRYANEPAVIYEICNEPNGNVTWEGQIRPYAMELIPVLRAIAPESVVLVGTGTWSQDVDQVAAHPLPFENVMYALHFYAGTHGASLRAKAVQALQAGTPIFVSEWGTSSADGSGGVYLDAAQTWLDFMAEHSLSWCNWSLCDKNESSAALRSGADANGGWKQSDLSESGQFVFAHFKD